MRLPRLIQNSLLLLPLFFAAQKVCAQLAPADDFFNGGAQAYISNNIPAALERVETGLKIYPDDEKLKKLEELLKQKNQQQQQQNQSQQQKSDSQKNQQQQNQQSQKNNSSKQQKSDEQKQNRSDQKKDGQQNQPEPQKSADEKKDGDKQDKQDAEGQPVKPGQMTPEEAKRLLDAQKGDEQILQMKPQDKPRDPNRPVKDW
jgi:Ca-activated chloride channel family protein